MAYTCLQGMPRGQWGRGSAMKFEEYIKSEESAVKHCARRPLCPLGAFCGVEDAEGNVDLFPHILDVSAGDLVWTDARYQQRIYIIQSGLFECVTNLELEEEKPFALFGGGYGFGFAELYVDRKVAQTYYFRALTPGRVCSFAGKVVRRRLEELENSELGRILCCSLLNLSSASFCLTKILLESLLYDRVAQLLVYLHYLLVQGGENNDVLCLGHAAIAEILGIDRASTTRTLHKLENDGLIELGYRSIRLLEPIHHGPYADTVRPVFHIP